MKKRFTDIDIWKKPWFRKLTTQEKLTWYYIKDDCDNVGVWEPDFDIAEIRIGSKIDWDEFVNKCNGNIEILSNGKYFLNDFCIFQYGILSEESRSKPIQSYITMLKKHHLFKGYVKVMERLKDKDKDKEKEKEKEIRKYADNVRMAEGEYNKLLSNYGKKQVDRMVQKLDNYKGSNGKKYKSDYRAILTWVIESVGAVEIEHNKMSDAEKEYFKENE